jgi:hypothetical protein
MPLIAKPPVSNSMHRFEPRTELVAEDRPSGVFAKFSAVCPDVSEGRSLASRLCPFFTPDRLLCRRCAVRQEAKLTLAFTPQGDR